MTPYAQTNLQLYRQLRRLGGDEDAVARLRAGYGACVRLFTACYRPSGKTFVAHLVGTASVLAEHAAPLDVVLAGLLHSAYSHGEFGTGASGVTAHKRRWLQDAVGPAAEQWIARYTALAWNTDTLRDLAGRPGDLAPDECTLVLMRAANELEELLDLGLGERSGGATAVERARERISLLGRVLRACDLEGLADELDTALDAQRPDSPSAPGDRDARARPLAGRGSSYVLPPLSHGLRPSVALRRVVRRSIRRARHLVRGLWPPS